MKTRRYVYINRALDQNIWDCFDGEKLLVSGTLSQIAPLTEKLNEYESESKAFYNLEMDLAERAMSDMARANPIRMGVCCLHIPTHETECKCNCHIQKVLPKNTDKERYQLIVDALKSQFVKDSDWRVAEDWACDTCKKPLVELKRYSSCSAGHPCPTCRYIPYVKGVFMGCLCGVQE